MANELTGKNPSERLINMLSPNTAGNSLDVLANALRDSSKIVILTQVAYDALAVKDPNTLYITVG